ncbi:hypothetical protein LINGRAHAP2_LOCUS24201 [Linum grandiflorum]
MMIGISEEVESSSSGPTFSFSSRIVSMQAALRVEIAAALNCQDKASATLLAHPCLYSISKS